MKILRFMLGYVPDYFLSWISHQAINWDSRMLLVLSKQIEVKGQLNFYLFIYLFIYFYNKTINIWCAD